MELEDLKLPDDEFRKKLGKLCAEGFDFEHLVEAANDRNRLMGEMVETMQKHTPNALWNASVSPVSFTKEQLPRVIRDMLPAARTVGCSLLPWVIDTTQQVCRVRDEDSKRALKDLLTAIVKKEGSPPDILSAAEVIRKQLDS